MKWSHNFVFSGLVVERFGNRVKKQSILSLNSCGKSFMRNSDPPAFRHVPFICPINSAEVVGVTMVDPDY